MLILAFDTATSIATSALVRGGTVLGERTTTPVRVLEDVDALLREAGARALDQQVKVPRKEVRVMIVRALTRRGGF